MDVHGFLVEVMRSLPFKARLGLRAAVWLVGARAAPRAPAPHDDRAASLPPTASASSRRWCASRWYGVRSLVMLLKTFGALLYAGDDADPRTPSPRTEPHLVPLPDPASPRRMTLRSRRTRQPCSTHLPVEARHPSPTISPDGRRRRRRAPRRRRRRRVRLRRRRLGRGGRRRRARPGPERRQRRDRRGGAVGAHAPVRRARVRRLPPHVPRRRDAGHRGARVHPAPAGTLRRRQHGHELRHRAPHARRTCSTSGGASASARSITARALEPHFDALERELSAQAGVRRRARREQPPVPRRGERCTGCPRAGRTATSTAAAARAAASPGARTPPSRA